MHRRIIPSHQNIAVLGAGGWGTAISILLAKNNFNVNMWEYSKKYTEILKKKRENIIFLKHIKIPSSVNITNDPQEAIDNTNLIILTIPSRFLRKSLNIFKRFINPGSFVISGIKGIEEDTLKRPSEIIRRILKTNNIAVISGPSHAEEVAKFIPTAIVAAGKFELTFLTQKLFSNKFFRVYPSKDIIGVELGGALKNIIAISAGILDHFYSGDNTKAALITRGLAEITKLGVKMGADPVTFFGLSGIGDLIVTCSSRYSRNRKVGNMLAQGKTSSQIIKRMKMVAEGIITCKSVHKLAKKYKIEMPITEEVYKIIYNKKHPKSAFEDILNRTPAKGEFDFN